MQVATFVKKTLTGMGRKTLSVIQEMGRLVIFFCQAGVQIFIPPFQYLKTIQQIHFMGMKSIPIICLTGASTGMVLGLQGYFVLVKYGSSGTLGSAVALTLVREMGPVMTAIMITARAGSAMAAELGIMRIGEQIDALKTMGVNPVRFLVSPRLAAALISFPLLTAIFDVVGIAGGYLTGSVLMGLEPGIYFSRVESGVELSDVIGGFIKAVVFAVAVTAVCCFQGYYTHRRGDGFGAKGVTSSTTSAVVISCALVLVVDYVLTSFLL